MKNIITMIITAIGRHVSDSYKNKYAMIISFWIVTLNWIPLAVDAQNQSKLTIQRVHIIQSSKNNHLRHDPNHNNNGGSSIIILQHFKQEKVLFERQAHEPVFSLQQKHNIQK